MFDGKIKRTMTPETEVSILRAENARLNLENRVLKNRLELSQNRHPSSPAITECGRMQVALPKSEHLKAQNSDTAPIDKAISGFIAGVNALRAKHKFGLPPLEKIEGFDVALKKDFDTTFDRLGGREQEELSSYIDYLEGLVRFYLTSSSNSD